MHENKSKPSNINTGIKSLFSIIIVVVVILILVGMAPVILAVGIIAGQTIAVILAIWLVVWLLGAGVNAIKKN